MTRSHPAGKELPQIIAEAHVRLFNLGCTWQEFDAYARHSGLSGERAAKKMKREGLA